MNVNQSDVTVKDSRLNRVDRVAPDHLFGLDDLDVRQLRCSLNQRLERDRQTWGDGAADVFAFWRNQIDRRRRAEVDDDGSRKELACRF